MLIFLEKFNILDEVTYHKYDFEVQWTAVNYNEGPAELNPLNGVVRYEFVEFIVRIAIEKFMVRGECKTEYEAVK